MEDRIRKIIEYYGLNVRQFEQKISASEGQIYKYLSRGGGLNSDTLSKILDKCQEISPDWLLLGKGEMLRSDPPKPAPEGSRSDEIWKEILAEKDRRIEELIIENYKIREQVAHIQAITPPISQWTDKDGVTHFQF